jgi:hypothetical protein
LDHVEWYAFARELDGVGVARLVRREAAPHTGGWRSRRARAVGDARGLGPGMMPRLRIRIT